MGVKQLGASVKAGAAIVTLSVCGIAAWACAGGDPSPIWSLDGFKQVRVRRSHAAAPQQPSGLIETMRAWETLQRVNADVTAKRVAACGVRDVVVEDELSKDPYRVKILTGNATNAQLECAIQISGETGIYAELHPVVTSDYKDMRSYDAAQQKKTDVVANRVAKCGVTGVHAVHNDYMFWVKADLDTATRAQLTCAAKVEITTGMDVSFSEELLNSPDTYSLIEGALWPQAVTYRNKTVLARRGILSRLPRYQYGRSDDLAFARSLERLCGPKAHHAIRWGTKGDGPDRDGTLIWDESKLDNATKNCLEAAVELSDLPHGPAYWR